jgi:hypothetical protein
MNGVAVHVHGSGIAVTGTYLTELPEYGVSPRCEAATSRPSKWFQSAEHKRVQIASVSPAAVTGPSTSRVDPPRRKEGAEQLGHRRAGAAHLDRERRGTAHFRRPPRPAPLAVVTLGGLSLGARPGTVPAGSTLARPVRERLPVSLGAELGRQRQASPVSPVEQSDHFWQASHGGTIRGKSAGGRGRNATPFGRSMPYAGLRPARLG